MYIIRLFYIASSIRIYTLIDGLLTNNSTAGFKKSVEIAILGLMYVSTGVRCADLGNLHLA